CERGRGEARGGGERAGVRETLEHRILAFRVASEGWIARAGGQVDRRAEVQLHWREQRCRSGSGRRPDRGRRSGAAARGPYARELWPEERPAGLSPAARIPRAQAQAGRRDFLHLRRCSDRVGLAPGARPHQWRAAHARRHRRHRAGDLSRCAHAAQSPGRQCGRHSARPGWHALAAALADLKRRNVRPKYIYTIPTVQNPTGTIMPEHRRIELLRLSKGYGVPIFEDDCYADLVWDGRRPPALYAMSKTGGVIHIGSVSKAVAPALRVGFIVAGWQIVSRALALKTDAGSGALEQMVLAEFCAPHFEAHVPKLRRGLRAKLETLMAALNEQFGTAAEFDDPKGGIFLWV